MQNKSEYEWASIEENVIDKNTDRRRHYGLRIGDIVDQKGLDGKSCGEAVVIEYGFFDNNRVMVRKKDGTITDWVAEWCDIIVKVEDVKTKENEK